MMDPLMGVVFGDFKRSDVEAVVDLSKVTRLFPKNAKWSSEFTVKVAPLIPTEPAISSSKFIPPKTNGISPATSNGHTLAHILPNVNGHSAALSELSPAVEKKQELDSTPKPPPPLKPEPPKSWADLVKKNNPPSSTPATAAAPSVLAKKPPQSGTQKFFKDFSVNFRGRPVQPRGLVNNGNMCFMNALLQPLVHCAPFVNLFRKLREEVAHNLKIKTPLVDAMIDFLLQFTELSADGKMSDTTFSADSAFEPENVYEALRSLKGVDSVKGRQEDAEEFLGFLLDGLHEELLASKKGKGWDILIVFTVQHGESYQMGKNVGVMNGGGTWLEVGPKNRTAVTRKTEILESPITQIFGGRVRSNIKRHGSKDSAMLEPFVSLQLDIAPDNIHTIEDALHLNAEVTKQNLFDHLPPILIMHMKRFVFDVAGGSQKIRKHVAFSPILKIRPELSSASSQLRSRNLEYRLFAVVNHHGKHLEAGHYTCDVAQNDDTWLYMDDASITPISIQNVVADEPERQAYMLFYARI
ncbi:hypothetical protein BC829DRAFT_393685 [Chytridium lagenaria]|nr:hypothetical protein BC829DRAFT_393685 [Chytridium lagenaria]